MRRAEAIESLYDLVTGDEDARVCKDIPEEACHEQPRNFFLQIGALVFSKTGDELASARLVLPWLLSAAGAPAYFTGLLVPVRESLSLLPQLFVAAALRRRPRRKWAWVAGSIVQGACVAAMGWAALTFDGARAGWIVLGLLVVFSLARGVCSVAFKDVLGKTVSKTRRGRLTGYATALAGVATVGSGAWLSARGGGFDAPQVALLVAAAGALWLVAAILYAGLSETPGATGGGGNAGRQAVESIALLWTDPPFRRFVAVRALLISTALLTPFYAALAREIGDGGLDDLGLLLLASGAAAALSSAAWGRMSDRSSRRVLELAAVLAGSLSLAVAAWAWAGAPGPRPGLVMAGAFLAMAAAHAGIRVGRKTYLVDMAGPDNRAKYVAVSNTAIGVLLLAGGVFGWIAQWLGLPATIGLLGIISLTGALGAVRLDEVTR